MISKKVNPLSSDRLRQLMLDTGVVLKVPHHIVRVDSYSRNTHGWQVRFKKPSKFFNDFDGSPRTSLRNAKAYLLSIYKIEKKKTSLNKSKTLPDVGVRVERNTKGHWYATAYSPIRGKAPKRFYIGTDNTRTDNMEKISYQRALIARKNMIMDHCLPIR